MNQLSLFPLLRGYSALLLPQNLAFPSHIPFSIIQAFLIDRILLNPHLEAYPPSERYQHSFWKWATQCLETMPKDDDDEIDEQIYERYVSLLAQSRSGPPPQSYVTHYWSPPNNTSNEYESITLLESRTTIESGTTGLRTWRASLVLAQYLISNPNITSQKIVLELGCGTGFVGIIVASLMSSNPSPIYLTDVNEDVLARCRDNVQLPCNKSSLHPSVRYRILDWSDALNAAVVPLRSFFSDASPQVILGADLVFDHTIFPSLVGVLSLAVKGGTMALIALTVRNEDTLECFLHQARDVLRVEQIPYVPPEITFVGISEGDVDGGQEVRIFKFLQK
ncbi:hypothetical protein BV22DRAFT_1037234 [Leucogyrophana mollusca]|uniref:Uncharacterized protein n=1 Tax=Leucogyrophana mollusca TaxID=85980 RepID=A0ACB8BAR4_9AGAM|nr:hypothetical protein BV22DRAFT_1037234 [Leucogyrophana mollusca]